MENKHSISELRAMLKAVRECIEALESKDYPPTKRGDKVRSRVEEAKINEIVILAKLAERGVKL